MINIHDIIIDHITNNYNLRIFDDNQLTNGKIILSQILDGNEIYYNLKLCYLIRNGTFTTVKYNDRHRVISCFRSTYFDPTDPHIFNTIDMILKYLYQRMAKIIVNKTYTYELDQVINGPMFIASWTTSTFSHPVNRSYDLSIHHDKLLLIEDLQYYNNILPYKLDVNRIRDILFDYRKWPADHSIFNK